MFIRWHLPDGTHFNYETTQTIEITDDEYISYFNISQHALSSKMYMTPLTDKQIIATNYVEIACSFTDSEFAKQLELCDKSLMNYNNYVNAWLTKGEIFALQNNFDEAITCFNKVLELDSLNYRTFDYIGSLYSRQNKSTDAITHFTKAISCNPNDPQPYMHRAEEYLKIDNVDDAMADFESATSFLNEFTIFKFLVNYIKLTELEQKIMEAYLKKYDNNK